MSNFSTKFIDQYKHQVHLISTSLSQTITNYYKLCPNTNTLYFSIRFMISTRFARLHKLQHKITQTQQQPTPTQDYTTTRFAMNTTTQDYISFNTTTSCKISLCLLRSVFFALFFNTTQQPAPTQHNTSSVTAACTNTAIAIARRRKRCCHVLLTNELLEGRRRQGDVNASQCRHGRWQQGCRRGGELWGRRRGGGRGGALRGRAGEERLRRHGRRLHGARDEDDVGAEESGGEEGRRA